MKQNFTFAFCYFFYLAIGIFLQPLKTPNSFTESTYIRSIQKQEVLLAREETDLLHGDLLFKF